MRADFASAVTQQDEAFVTFVEGIDDFCRHYGKNGNAQPSSPLARDLEPLRKSTTSIPDFYRVVYPQEIHRASKESDQ